MRKTGSRGIEVSFTKAEREAGLPECTEARATGLGMGQAEYIKHLIKKDLRWYSKHRNKGIKGER